LSPFEKGGLRGILKDRFFDKLRMTEGGKGGGIRRGRKIILGMIRL
jgi:hypothetical protein